MSDFDTILARLQRGYHEGGHHPRCTTLADEGCDCYARGTVEARAALSRVEAAAEQTEDALANLVEHIDANGGCHRGCPEHDDARAALALLRGKDTR